MSLHNFDFYELQNDEKLRQIFDDLNSVSFTMFSPAI